MARQGASRKRACILSSFIQVVEPKAFAIWGGAPPLQKILQINNTKYGPWHPKEICANEGLWSLSFISFKVKPPFPAPWTSSFSSSSSFFQELKHNEEGFQEIKGLFSRWNYWLFVLGSRWLVLALCHGRHPNTCTFTKHVTRFFKNCSSLPSLWWSPLLYVLWQKMWQSWADLLISLLASASGSLHTRSSLWQVSFSFFF